jgi:acetolactate decarboxylase
MGDGSVKEPADSASAPFWVSAEFEADRTITIDKVSSWEELCTHIDGLRRSENLFTAIRIDGLFEEIHYRVACRSAPGTDLVTATSHQAEFTLQNIQGSLIGFWSPVYARTFNIPGYHLHLLSSDHRHGGHILGIRANNLKLQVMDANQLTMALPESPGFLKADLSGDPSAALKKAEGAQSK